MDGNTELMVDQFIGVMRRDGLSPNLNNFIKTANRYDVDVNFDLLKS